MTLVYWTGAWLFGIFVAGAVRPPTVLLWALLPGAALGAVLLRTRDWAGPIAACALMLLAGALRLNLTVDQLEGGQTLVPYYDQPVVLQGVVSAAPDVQDTLVTVPLVVDEVLSGAQHVSLRGSATIWTGLYPSFAYGDRIRAEGTLRPPDRQPGRLSYRDYSPIMNRPRLELLGKGPTNPFVAALHTLQERSFSVITDLFADPEGALLAGILLGTTHAIPRSLNDSFTATGTSHIVVISGFNIAIVAMILARGANRWLARRTAIVLSVVGIVFYATFVGLGAAVVRAAIMAGLAAIAICLGRQSMALVSLAAAALFMTLFDPLVLWDLSFQLSTGATLGLVLFCRPLQFASGSAMATSGRLSPVRRLLDDTLVTTLAAQVFTLPLIVFYFHRLSPVMLLANTLVLPVQPALMGSGALATVAGLVWLPAGQAAAAVAWLFLAYTVRVVQALARVPFASVDVVPLSAATLWIYFAVAGLVGWLAQRAIRNPATFWQSIARQFKTKVVLAALILLATLTWTVVYSLPDGRLHVRFLDVGQGDAILITTPAGNQIVIDGGPSPGELLSQLGQAMPFWDRRIDLVALSHADSDHLSGFPLLLERYDVRSALDAARSDTSLLYARWRQLLRDDAIPVQRASAGEHIDLGAGAYVEVLFPTDASEAPATGAELNATSAVLRLVYGQTSFLFTGDLDADGEAALLRSGRNLNSTVLKVSHHGAKGATGPAFLRAVNPQLAIISVGQNRFGHPAPETLARLAAVPVLRTDENGTIEVTADGIRCWTDAKPSQKLGKTLSLKYSGQ